MCFLLQCYQQFALCYKLSVFPFVKSSLDTTPTSLRLFITRCCEGVIHNHGNDSVIMHVCASVVFQDFLCGTMASLARVDISLKL